MALSMTTTGDETVVDGDGGGVSGDSGGRKSEGWNDGKCSKGVRNMLDLSNSLVQVYRMVKERICTSGSDELRLRLIKTRNSDGRLYNLPVALEIVALIVGDIENYDTERDILVENQTGCLQRITQSHPLYLPMQYPLLFPHGEDGYRDDVQLRQSVVDSGRKRIRLTIRQYFSYRLQDRISEPYGLLSFGKLSQQFIVDGYCMIESSRLRYIQSNQDNLRAELYNGLSEATSRGDLDPSSLASYTVEFQKHGLLHCHILIFLDKEDKYIVGHDIDRIKCAEILDKNTKPELHEAVKAFMLHGPCGHANPKSPCMKDKRCSKHLPKNSTRAPL
ncbi:uncharacterized protein G2W53_041325 [Senna tora]|uniref:Helitron helicase-like domain-containing protein n=1 Tax=Senna tora TaxID=362788 RepID=A0A834SRV0_9FABA|nr:uncharacterized protein G2W53_041325 [Senna tora]